MFVFWRRRIGGIKLRADQTQLFAMEYGTRCDTFGCGESASHMVGRPDGPLNTCHVLCQVCTDSLVQSIKEQFAKPDNKFVIGIDDPIALEVEVLLDDITTHARLDDFVEQNSLVGIPKRDEEGGKLQERKAAILKKLNDV